MIKDVLTKDYLSSLYHEQNMTTYQIGEKYGCSAGYVQNLIKQYGIPKKKTVEEKIDRETLYDLYHNQRLSCVKIGKLYGHRDHVIGKLMDKYGISKKREPLKKPTKKTLGSVLNKEYLLENYTTKKKTTMEIASEVGCHPSSVDYYLKKHKIGNNWLGNTLDRKTMHDLYIDSAMTATQIAHKYDCHTYTIERLISDYGLNATDRNIRNLALIGKQFELYVKEMFETLGYEYLYQYRGFKGIIPDFYDDVNNIIIDAKISSTTPFASNSQKNHFFNDYNVSEKVVILYLDGSPVRPRGIFEWVNISTFYDKLISVGRVDLIKNFENLKSEYKRELACQ